MKKAVVLKDLNLMVTTMTSKIRECPKYEVERLRKLDKIRASLLAAIDIVDSLGDSRFQNVLSYVRVRNAFRDNRENKQTKLFEL